MTIEAIAQLCHEANRVLCEQQEDYSQTFWHMAPIWQRQSALKGVAFHLTAHAKGERPSPAASHESWLEEKRRDGWTYGPVKDAVAKTHPCFVPYEELPAEQRVKDYLFGHIVAAVVEAGLAPEPAIQG